jgi:hypothetical protein
VEWDVPGARLLEFALDYARRVEKDWKEFCTRKG